MQCRDRLGNPRNHIRVISEYRFLQWQKVLVQILDILLARWATKDRLPLALNSIHLKHRSDVIDFCLPHRPSGFGFGHFDPNLLKHGSKNFDRCKATVIDGGSCPIKHQPSDVSDREIRGCC
jgi:hypothetical protein